MSVTGTHAPYGVEIGTTKLMATHALDWGTQMRSEALSDEPYARLISVVGERPTGRITTLNVAAALTKVPTLGLDIASNAVNFWFQKRVDGTTRATGDNHTKVGCTKGMIAPMTLRCEYGGDAVIEYFVLPRSTDGAAHPFTPETGQALPDGFTDGERFTLPPADSIDVGDKALNHVRGIEIDFGLQLAVEGADNEVCDTMVWLVNVAPVITLRGVDPGWIAEAKVPVSGGLACTHADTNIYLQKRADQGTLVAAGTEGHIKFTACGLAVPETYGGETSIRIRCKYDGSTDPVDAPLTVDAGSEIT